MGWVTENFKKHMHLTNPQKKHEQRFDSSFESQVNRKWTELIKELEHDTDEFRRLGGKADFKQPTGFQCRISNPDAGVALLLAVDMNAHTIHYEYEAEQKNVAVPEGGFLSLRAADSGMALYSADQLITTQQACRLLLEPLLFPPISSVELRTGT
jgi:hypothetical protein